MLIKCPECGENISDKAISCPHCGYPIKHPTKNRNKSHKYRRLPNGFGQISEIHGKNLRNPFRAMVTVSKDTRGHSKCKTLGYFPSYNDAYQALIEYNKNPYELDPSTTIEELYHKWLEMYTKKTKSVSTLTAIDDAWMYCSSIYKMKVSDLRARHIKGCMEDGTIIYRGKEQHPSGNVKAKIKSIFNLMLDYAVEYELVDKNVARTFTLSEDIREEMTTKKGHIVYTEYEMDTLWKHLYKEPYVDVLLIQCYSGWRPQELGLIEIDNVDLKNGFFTGGMKTKAGTNRTVPIHSRIYPLVEKRYNESKSLNSQYLFTCTDSRNCRTGNTLTYEKYRNRFNKICDDLGLDPQHRCHDGRKHFITQAKRYNVDEYAIKYIVGHSITDITEKVYTQRDKSWLKEEIEKIK